MKNIIILSICFFLGYSNLNGQIVFYCPIEVGSNNLIFSECEYFYNYLTGSMDSIEKVEIKNVKEENIIVTSKEKVLVQYKFSDLTQKSGIVKYLYNDNVILEGEIQYGLPNGKFTYAYGAEKNITYFINGLREGESITIFENGKKVIENYHNGKLDGLRYKLDQDQNCYYSSMYSKGKLDGPTFELHDNNTLSFFYLYKDGQLVDGIYYRFDGDGEIVHELIVKNGKTEEKYY